MQYTVVITSCDRHDLLKTTIQSLRECVDHTPVQTIIVEDGPAPEPEWLKSVTGLGKVIWLSNGVRMGQIYSIDRAYSEVTTEYIFHCEDDWTFKEQGFIRPSFDILQKHPEIIQVSLRGDTGWHPLTNDAKYPFKVAEPYWRGGWGGLSFNPGLRRMADYRKLGSYGLHVSYGTSGLSHELQLSRKLLDMGYRIADRGIVHVEHSGNGRSRAIESIAALPRILIAVPACHKFEYGKWESSDSPHYNRAHEAYGTDIHISGENPRTGAIRQTWFKDIETFKSHVTGKFFYGLPHSRQPLDDEVFLNVNDNYASLPFKTIAICRWALENGYEWLFKCDDDTAVYVDRLVQELLTNRFDYAGWEHSGVCTGGPGYWLSKRAMKIVTEYSPTHWAEDVTVAHALSNARIRPQMLDSHKPGFTGHWYFGNRFDPTKLSSDIVTMHAVQPDVMRAWHSHK